LHPEQRQLRHQFDQPNLRHWLQNSGYPTGMPDVTRRNAISTVILPAQPQAETG